jgi:6-phosphofructokinase 1
MGRHAGFLTAAGAAWRRDEADGPHILCFPERPFSTKDFLEEVGKVHARHGRCVVAMSEGVAGEDGKSVVESLLGDRVERDAHGNVRLGGGDLGIAVQAAINEAFPKVRSRVDTFGYLPRAFGTMIGEVDRKEAFDVGVFAVATSNDGSGSVARAFKGGETVLRRVPLAFVAGKTRLMPKEFVAPSGTELSAAGMAYLARLVPKAPEIMRPLI